MKVEIIIPESTTGKTYFRLLEPMVYLGYTIPRDFVTDGVSSPRFLHVVFPQLDSYLLAAVVHDYLLQTGHGWVVANRAFSKGLKDLNVPLWKRKLLESAVWLASKWYR